MPIGERFHLRGVPVVVVREGPLLDRMTWKQVATFVEVERDDGGRLADIRGGDAGGPPDRQVDRGLGVARNRRRFSRA